jgi:RNA polymerase sigma-70 factor (ECF subfamily)
MTQAGTEPAAALPIDPVRAALDDPDVRTKLLHHAVARLTLWLADRRQSVGDEAGEAVQEACKRAVERAAEFDPARSRVAAWLHGILNNVLHEHCRAIHKAPQQPEASPAEWENLAAPMMDDDPARLDRLLEGIREDDRQIVTMHHLDGLSHDEIATAMKISVGTSRIRMYRAMTELKKLAAKEGGQ